MNCGLWQLSWPMVGLFLLLDTCYCFVIWSLWGLGDIGLPSGSPGWMHPAQIHNFWRLWSCHVKWQLLFFLVTTTCNHVYWWMHPFGTYSMYFPACGAWVSPLPPNQESNYWISCLRTPFFTMRRRNVGLAYKFLFHSGWARSCHILKGHCFYSGSTLSAY